MNEAPLAFMDSGVGGLTILKPAFAQLPAENTLFFGDEAHLPYGEKQPQQVIDYSLQIGRFFVKKQAKLMIIACNTASALALPTLQAELPIPVLGVVEGGSRAAIQATTNHKIGIIATRATVNSHAYQRAIHRLSSQAEVVELACPTFIPLVEQGDYHSERVQQMVIDGLAPLQGSGIDTLVLGCTHFPIIRELIQSVMGPTVTLVDPGAETIAEAHQVLEQRQLLAQDQHPFHDFYTSSDPERFQQVGSQWLNRKVDVQLVTPSQLSSYDN
ncbi:glutamate racemase [Fructilactobacillus carniphilus]|uniref:Glutamate racemase n=1 Tax=Fructilactobacillus carniphilus TaxID=2940297 RepID=A0ABY5C0U0_9LACO|nr:glutamate racemase [Fructilactobacillus carniphilus]USS91233.1 glutamate racemase [Fructilactobacillus carniphilus]